MSKKAKKAVSQPVQAAQEAVKIPQDLSNQVQSIRALAQCYNLLQKGLYPHGYAVAIDQSLQFLQILHTQALAEAVKHPQASLVEELKAFLEQSK